MEQIMAIYDTDSGYADRFADFANQKEKVPFKVMAFTTIETLQEYAGKHKISILFLGSQIPEEQLKEISATEVVHLTEGKSLSEKKEYVQVYKYQSTHSLLREAMSHYGDEPVEDMEPDWGSRARMIGVYSPIGGCGKTAFAWTLGQQIGKESKTLFLSLEEYSGFSRMLKADCQADLADVIYLYRRGSYSGIRLGSMIQNRGNMDYIPPVRYPEDLCQLEGEETAALLRKIAGESHYETIVVDMGNMGRLTLPIIEACDIVYMPIKETPMAAARLDEFDQYLEVSGRGELRGRIQRLKLPAVPCMGRPEDYPEQLVWGEMGDYVRLLLKGGIAL